MTAGITESAEQERSLLSSQYKVLFGGIYIFPALLHHNRTRSDNPSDQDTFEKRA